MSKSKFGIFFFLHSRNSTDFFFFFLKQFLCTTIPIQKSIYEVLPFPVVQLATAVRLKSWIQFKKNENKGTMRKKTDSRPVVVVFFFFCFFVFFSKRGWETYDPQINRLNVFFTPLVALKHVSTNGLSVSSTKGRRGGEGGEKFILMILKKLLGVMSPLPSRSPTNRQQ